MKIGSLVRVADPWGPDKYDNNEYYPVGVVYRQHSKRNNRWWVQWASPGHISGEVDCELEWDLEVLNETR